MKSFKRAIRCIKFMIIFIMIYCTLKGEVKPTTECYMKRYKGEYRWYNPCTGYYIINYKGVDVWWNPITDSPAYS